MFLTKKTTRGVSYLYLMEAHYIPGKAYPVNKIVKNYGRYENAPEELRRQYEDSKARKAVAKKLEWELRHQELSAASEVVKEQLTSTVPTVCTATTQMGNFNKLLTLHYGHLVFKGIWEQEFGLRYKIDHLQKKYTEIKNWRLNDLLFYLCSLKVLSPSSYLEASISKGNFLYCPWNNVTQDNFYRALDFVYEHREGLIKHAVKERIKHTKTEIRVAFFDCTNTYFETPYDDVTWQTIKATREICNQLHEQGYSSQAIEDYLKSEEFAQELNTTLTNQQDEVLRMRGPSKEGRFAQPLVTVALAIDQTGFPIDCKVFSGNISEHKTIKPVLNSLKEKYAVKDVYFVADRGLNSTESLHTLKEENMGFVVAQKISNQTSSARKEMLDLNGYRNYALGEDGEFDALDGECHQDSYRYKVCEYTKVCYSQNNELAPDGKRKKITVKCKIIYTFSPERKARELAELEDMIAKASDAVNTKKLMGNAYSSGWRSLIKTQKECVQDKTSRDLYRAIGLKENVIAERKAIAGYAAVVFTHPSNESELQLTEEQVLKTYHRLVSIEDCFRVMKSNFSIRPVYVRLKERIIAHCYLCVLSLMLLRTLQSKLESANIHLSAKRICEALSQACVAPLPSKPGMERLFVNIGINQKFHTPERTGKRRSQSTVDETLDLEASWEKFKKEREESPDDFDQILTAVGLQPLNVYNTMGNLKTKLGLRSVPVDKMMATEHLKYIERLSSTM